MNRKRRLERIVIVRRRIIFQFENREQLGDNIRVSNFQSNSVKVLFPREESSLIKKDIGLPRTVLPARGILEEEEGTAQVFTFFQVRSFLRSFSK